MTSVLYASTLQTRYTSRPLLIIRPLNNRDLFAGPEYDPPQGDSPAGDIYTRDSHPLITTTKQLPVQIVDRFKYFGRSRPVWFSPAARFIAGLTGIF